MLRLRFLRLLLPLLILLVGVVLWRTWEPRGAPHREAVETTDSQAPRVEGLSFVDYNEHIAGHAAVFEPHDDGSLHLEGIRDLELQREKRGPLLVSAKRGMRLGGEETTRWIFEDEVVFREPDEGLTLTLPSLEIDDEAGEARSQGDIRFEAPNVTGRAASLLYGMRGQVGELMLPEFEDTRGSSVAADRARLLDGVRDVELVGRVRAKGPGRELTATNLRLIRGPEDRLRQAMAEGDVAGTFDDGLTAPGRLAARKLDLRWDSQGEVDFAALEGEALVARGDQTLAARRIQAARDSGAARPWRIDATDGVYVQGRFGDEPGLLRAEQLQAWLSETFDLREADASGHVSFDGRDTRAEAERGTFRQTGEAGGQIELFGDGLRKARLAQARTRVAARTIRTDVAGRDLWADGLVEATLLPATGPDPGPSRTRLFSSEQAIHFVSERMRSLDSGRRLTFTGSVRGWQDERNLAAGSVEVDDRRHTVVATDAVSTRIPRESSAGSAGEGDYVHIASDRLDYDDVGGLAVYQGGVRVRLVEGWLEAERVEVQLQLDGREIHEIRASDGVRIEFHRAGDDPSARPVSGTGDRLVYVPAEGMLRLFGDSSPATVRRIGGGGGTTTGRVLRYSVDTGTLDVDSGEQGPGTIQG